MRYVMSSLVLIAAACGGGATPAVPTANAPTESTPSDSTLSAGPLDDRTAPSTSPPEALEPAVGSGLITSEGVEIPLSPSVPDGPASAALTADLELLFTALEEGRIDSKEIAAVASYRDARTAWMFADILRFTRSGEQSEAAIAAFETVTGVTPSTSSRGRQWKGALDYLIAWDLPALDDYATYKGRLYSSVEPGWAPFFDDPGATIDWRLVAWGGVFIDDRPLGVRDGCPRGCIPALDHPLTTDAAGGAWLDDDRIVFGITINGESRAYPKHQMETHEMVNDTLGGRRIGIPYCTLCGSAQAYFTDSVPDGVETPVLRTSGLLSRSNKVMFDLISYSLFDTFTGSAVTGPLREIGVRLDQATVVASTWGAWKAAHLETTIVAEDGGIGFVYLLDPLRGRDDNGPIFPVGDVDPRLDVQELIVGVEYEEGSVVAFPKRAAIEHLESGGMVEFADVTILLDGSGLRAVRADGTDVATHEAFWFAWSQFWPDTALWAP